jgi:hypothetical protein
MDEGRCRRDGETTGLPPFSGVLSRDVWFNRTAMPNPGVWPRRSKRSEKEAVASIIPTNPLPSRFTEAVELNVGPEGRI